MDQFTVEEYVSKHNYAKLWLCPSLVSDGKISRNPLMQGLECTRTTIPNDIRNKKVRITFNDGGTCCIIWENDDDKSFLTFSGLLGQN